MPEQGSNWDPVSGLLVRLVAVSGFPSDVELLRVVVVSLCAVFQRVLPRCRPCRTRGRLQRLSPPRDRSKPTFPVFCACSILSADRWPAANGVYRGLLDFSAKFEAVTPGPDLHLVAELQAGSARLWRAIGWFSVALLNEDYSVCSRERRLSC